MDQIPEYVTIKQASELTGYDPSTIYGWFRSGKLMDYYRCDCGRTIFINFKELVQYIKREGRFKNIRKRRGKYWKGINDFGDRTKNAIKIKFFRERKHKNGL